MSTFEMWFEKFFIEAVKDRPGKILLEGVNLASHFSPRVIEMAKEHNVYFTCLPPNSIHSLQALDVSVFRPMKIEWRVILQSFWKECHRNERFPVLLSELWREISKKIAIYLASGFRATGLSPRNPLDASLIEILSKNQGNVEMKKARGSKVHPGQEITCTVSIVGSTSSGRRLQGEQA